MKAMTYGSFKSNFSSLFKTLNLRRSSDIYNLKIGMCVYRFKYDRLPTIFDQLLPSESQVTEVSTFRNYLQSLCKKAYEIPHFKNLGHHRSFLARPSLISIQKNYVEQTFFTYLITVLC